MIDFSSLLYITKVRQVFSSQTIVGKSINRFPMLKTNMLGFEFPDGQPIYKREWKIGDETMKDKAIPIPPTETLAENFEETHLFRVVAGPGDNLSSFPDAESLDAG